MPDAEPSSTAHSYEVLGKLAEGGVTEIFLARAKGVGAVERVVVLKRLKRAATTHVDQVRLFLEEAQRASQLQHPNIAQVFEVGRLGGSYFYAMEFVNGETLQSLMLHARSRKIQVPVRAVLTIAAAMAAGLHHAHDRNGTDGQRLGIVHGDVSPTNTLVSQEGIVKLVDFGVGKAGEEGRTKVTPYSSPEQCRGEAIDRRSDLFSLGIVLWELLTLDALYQRASDADIKAAIESEAPAAPSTKRYDVPPELDAMVLRLLAKNPVERFQDADELLAAIEALAQKLSILLSTADLSRMMRLWFGTKSEPAIDAAQPDAPQPVIVSSEEIPDDLAIPVQSPIDDQLDAVRSAAALIAVRATERSRNPTGRGDKPTVPPELMDNPNENFEQIRDRILARARQKKETRNPIPGVIPGGTGTGTMPPPLATGTPVPGPAPAGLPTHASMTAAAAPSGSAIAAIKPVQVPASMARVAGEGSDRHSRTTAQAPISAIEESLRKAGKAEPASASANGVNGHAAEDAVSGEMGGTTVADVPDTEPMRPAAETVVIDNDEIRGSRTASGELGAKAAAAVAAAAGNAVAADEPKVEASDAEPSHAEESDEHRAKTRAGDDDEDERETEDEREDSDDDERREAPAAARDVARRSDPERDEATERMSHSTATAHEDDEVGVDTLVPRGRPTWLVPVLGAAALLMVVLVVAKLVSGGKPAAAKQNDQIASTSNAVPASGGTPDKAAAAAADKAAADKAAADKAAADKAAADKAAADKAAADKAAADKAAADNAAAADKAAADKAAADKAAADKAAADKAAADKAAADKAAADKAAADKAAADKAAKAAADKAAKDAADEAAADKRWRERNAAKNADKNADKNAADTNAPEKKAKGIEEAFAAGDFAGTNTACTKEIVFTPQKLVMCAQAACQTKNAALAKRWINAISKAQRPELVDKCKSLGVELESPPPAP